MIEPPDLDRFLLSPGEAEEVAAASVREFLERLGFTDVVAVTLDHVVEALGTPPR